MSKSIFSRFFLTCTLIIIMSVAVLGVVLIVSFNSQQRNNSYELLTRIAQNSADLAAQNYLDNYGAYIDVGILHDGIRPIADAVETDIFLVEPAGGKVVFIESVEEGALLIGDEIPAVIISKALSAGYTEYGDFGGMLSSSAFVSGVPVKAGSTVIGVMFAASHEINDSVFSSDIMRRFLFAALIVMLTSFVVIYIMADKLTRPIRLMAQAAEAFAHGDFTVRVPVDGYNEIEKLALSFNEMAASLADLEASRRSMIANISHEFKTPITTVGGFIDGILDGTIPAEKQSHYLSVVSGEVKRLSRLIVSMLNLARIEAGEMTYSRQPVDISELLTRTLFNFEMKIEEKHIEIRGLDIEKIIVEADPDMAHQVVYNLIENAVKFTPVGGYIEVSHYNEGGKAYVSIKNSGGGIAKDEIPRMFDRFYKSDTSRSMDKTGVGLGLHIVKSTLHGMGGDIMVKSVQGEYADFIFSLALYKEKNSVTIFRKSETQKFEKMQ